MNPHKVSLLAPVSCPCALISTLCPAPVPWSQPGVPHLKSDAKFLIPEIPSLPLPFMSGSARGRIQTGKTEHENSVCGKAALWIIPIPSQKKKTNPRDLGGDSLGEPKGRDKTPPDLANRRYLTTRTVSLSAGHLVQKLSLWDVALVEEAAPEEMMRGFLKNTHRPNSWL